MKSSKTSFKYTSKFNFKSYSHRFIHDNKHTTPVKVVVEKWLFDLMFKEKDKFEALHLSLDLIIFDKNDSLLKNSIDFLITLGGDGTILYAAK